jgi:hypothetical protein
LGRHYTKDYAKALSDSSQFLFGNEPIGRRPNLRREIARVNLDPLCELFEAIDGTDQQLLSNPRSRYREAYNLYRLSVCQYLSEMSVAGRYSMGPYWTRRSGGKYTPSQRKLANKYDQIAPFLELDLINCLIHCRILLDRVVGVSQSFVTGKMLPSFTSFNDHKKFFKNLSTPYGAHEDYARHVRTRTNWFEMPLQAVRDKFVVHSAPRHMRSLGYRSDYELELCLFVPNDPKSAKPFESVKLITVNILRLSYDVEIFLKWFCAYGLASLASKKPSGDFA